METRTIEQVKIYKLVLSRMTGRFEDSSLVAIAYSAERLKEFYEGEKVEHYKDGNWSKQFRQGGPLEWYNDIDWNRDTGVYDEWTTQEDLEGFLSRPYNTVTLIQ